MTWKKQIQNIFLKSTLTKVEVENIITGLEKLPSENRKIFIEYLKTNKEKVLPLLQANIARKKRAFKSNNVRLFKKYLEADEREIKRIDKNIKELEDEKKLKEIRKKLTKK